MPDTVETAVRGVLVGASGVTDLVSTRVYPNSAPQSTTKPFIVYEVDTLEPVDALSGHAGLTFAQFTITSWGATYSDAKAVSAAVLAALGDYSGTSDNINIPRASHDSSRDIVYWPEDGSELPVHGVEQDWRITFRS